MAESITFDPRFCGPPDSGHGGYAYGRGAEFVSGTAEVTLPQPPPLGEPPSDRKQSNRVMRRLLLVILLAVLVSAISLRLAESTAAIPNGQEVVGTWSAGAAMPTARTEVTSALLDGVIYIIGGFRATGGHTNLVEAYDTGGDSWSVKASLPQSLDHAGAAAVGGKVYVVGGYSNFALGIISSGTYEYDPMADAWTTRSPMPLTRAAAATVALDGIIYVLGGVGPQAAIPLAYDPTANSWTQLAPMSAEREHLTASVADGKIYVVGGRQNVFQNVNTIEEYDPTTNSWQDLTKMPTSRGGLASGALAGRVHVVGGEDLSPGGSTFSEHEVYDPASDSWASGPVLPTPRHGLTAQVIDDRLYAIGGGPTPGLSVSDVVEIFQLGAIDAIGGLTEPPEGVGTPLEAPDSSGGNASRLAGTIAGVGALAVTLTGAAWYAWRRRTG